jgi:uncharacterized membrane protein YdbT with pleckstrin-like domain
VSFPTKLLNDGEEIVLDLRPHWLQLFWPATAVVVTAVVAVVINISVDIPALLYVCVALVAVSVIWLLLRYARWTTTSFVVTSHRLVYRHGVLAKQGREIPLDRLNDISFHQSIFERMIGAGDLGIESASRDGAETFNDVRKPSNVQNEIYRQMEGHTQRTYGGVQAVNQATQAAQAAAASAAGTSSEKSIPEQLRALDELRQQGVLTQAEFDAKKAQLLERM